MRLANAPVPAGPGTCIVLRVGEGCGLRVGVLRRVRAGRRGSIAGVNNFVVGLIAGAFGVAYFMYGKRQQRFVPLIAGMILCVYPYFVHGALWLAGIGLVLLAAPFLIDF